MLAEVRVLYNLEHAFIPRSVGPIQLTRSSRRWCVVLWRVGLCFDWVVFRFMLCFYFIIFEIVAAPRVVVIMLVLIFQPSLVGVWASRRLLLLKTRWARRVRMARCSRGYWTSAVDVGIPCHKGRELCTKSIHVPVDAFKQLSFCLGALDVIYRYHAPPGKSSPSWSRKETDHLGRTRSCSTLGAEMRVE